MAARSSIASNLIIADSSSTSSQLGYYSDHLTLRESFTVPSDVSALTGIEIGLFKKGAPAYPITVSITSSLTGTPLYQTTIQPTQIVSTSRTSPTWVRVILPKPLSITPGKRLFLSLSVARIDSSNFYRWPINGNDPYPGGTFYWMNSAKPNSDATMKLELMR
jgi:hypothetical protein